MATKCPCIREADRKKYGAMSEVCCAKQEKPVTVDDYKSAAKDLLRKVIKGAGKRKVEEEDPKRSLKKGGSVTKTNKWSRKTTRKGRTM